MAALHHALWALLASAAQHPAAATSSTADLSIYYDTDNAGLASNNCSLNELGLLLESAPPQRTTIALAETGLGVLEHKGRFIFAKGGVGDVLSTVASVSDKDRKIEVVAENVPLLMTPNGVALQWPREGFPDLMAHLVNANRESWRARSWQGDLVPVRGRLLRVLGGGKESLVVELPKGAAPDAGGPDGPPLPTVPEDYEFTATLTANAEFQGRTTQVYFLCRMTLEAGRRYRRLEDEMKKTPPERRLLLSAGSMLPEQGQQLLVGPEVMEGALKILSKMRYDAIAPAVIELDRGVDWLKKTAEERNLPIVAANLSYKTGPTPRATIFPAYRILRRGPHAIVVIGAVPEIAGRAVYGKRLGNAEVTPIDDAVDAAHKAAIAELGRRADLVILLTALEGKDALDRAHNTVGVDVVVQSTGTFRGDQELFESAHLPGDERPSIRRTLLAANGLESGIGRIDVFFGRDEKGEYVRAVDHYGFAVGHDLPRDEALGRAIMSAELATARRGADTLIPPLKDVIGQDPGLEKLSHPTAESTAEYWMATFWRMLAAHAARETLHTEIAAVRPFTLHVNSGGAMAASVVGSVIRNPTHAVSVALTGVELLDLAKLAVGDRELVYACFNPEKKLVDGRPLDPKQLYSIAVPDSVITDPVLAPIFRDKKVGDGPLLSELLVSRLRAMRDTAGGLNDTYFAHLKAHLSSEGEGPSPLWSLIFDQVALSYLVNRAVNTGAFTNVRDQRYQLPNFQVVTLKGTIAGMYDDQYLTWRTGINFKFRKIFFGDLDRTIPENQREFEDLINPDTELRLKVLKVSVGQEAYALVPFAKAGYETELTPVTLGTVAGGDYMELPRRSYLNGTVGIGLFPGQTLQELRIGGVLRNDFAKSVGRKLELGFNAGLRLLRPIGPLNARFDGTITYFPPQGEDAMVDADVVGLESQAILAVTVPISTWFNFGVNLDWLGFRGKVPSTERFGQSLQVGLMVSIDRVFKPGYEIAP